MSPVPLIELQRRLSRVGAIRAGGEKPERGVGRKLEAWRITSPRKQLIEQAAELYGGTVTPWTSPRGPEFQVYTEAAELPVLLIQGYSLSTKYELWEGATKRTRLCDGYDEELTGGPCICNAEGVDRCDVYSRLIVALPELDTMLGWQLITKGANAAHELPMMVDAARRITDAPLVPMRLHLDQRRGVKDGQVVRYVVPTLDLGVGYAALTAGAPNPRALALAEGPASERTDAVVSLPRRAAAFGPESIAPESATAPPVPIENGDQAQVTGGAEQTRMATEAQKAKLNVLVGTLREAGHIQTDGLYNAIGERLRSTAGLDLAATTPDWIDAKGVVHTAIDGDGVTHWAPLRETLTRVEANTLIDWLSKVEEREKSAATSNGEDAPPPQNPPRNDSPSAPIGTSDTLAADDDTVSEQQQIVVPFNEFPPGY